MNNGIEIYGLRYPAAGKVSELTGLQRQYFWEVLNRNMPLNDLKLHLLGVAVDLRQLNALKRAVFAFFLSAEHIQQALPLGEALLQPQDRIICNGQVLLKSRNITFLEFIKFNETLQALKTEYDVCRAIACRYHLGNRYTEEMHDRDALLIGHLNQHYRALLLQHVQQEHAQLIAGWPGLFNQSGGGGNGKQPASWYQVLRRLAPDITRLEDVANLPADTVFFDLLERLREKKELDKKLK